MSPEEVATKAAAKAAAKERYLKAYAGPAGKHVATQLPADTGALRPSRAGVGEGTPLRPIERARSHNRARQRQQQQTGVAATKAATLAAPTLSPEEVAAKYGTCQGGSNEPTSRVKPLDVRIEPNARLRRCRGHLKGHIQRVTLVPRLQKNRGLSTWGW